MTEEAAVSAVVVLRREMQVIMKKPTLPPFVAATMQIVSASNLGGFRLCRTGIVLATLFSSLATPLVTLFPPEAVVPAAPAVPLLKAAALGGWDLTSSSKARWLSSERYNLTIWLTPSSHGKASTNAICLAPIIRYDNAGSMSTTFFTTRRTEAH
jgi:hypothetical protein